MSNLPPSGVSLQAQNAGQFLADMGRAQRAVLDLADVPGRVSGGFSAMGEIVTGALREIGAMATQVLADAGRAAAGFVKDSIATAGDVEQTLNVLQVAGEATDAQMAAVSRRAKELGSDLTLPATSAQDASQAMLELVKSGFTVEQAMEAAKGALQLAAAGETDVANAAQVTAGALNAFHLPATDAVRITDLLAGAANASQASMTDLAQGLQQGGFAFYAAGQTVDDLATSLAILTKNNLSGSDSGTALKNMFMRLMNPTKKAAAEMRAVGFAAYDVNGNMKPLPQLLAEISRATSGMTREQRDAWLGTVFLSDGMKALIPLLEEGEAGFNATKAEVTASGQAAELAGAQMAGWKGVVEGVSSQIETLQLILGQKLLPIITPIGFKFAELLGIVGKFAEGGLSFDALTSLGMFLSEFNPQLGSFVSNLAIATDPVQTLKDALLTFISDLVAQLPGQLAALGEQLLAGAAVWREQLSGWVAEAGPPLLDNLGALIADLFDRILAAAPDLIDTLTAWRAALLQWVLDSIPGTGENLATYVTDLLDTLGEHLPAIVDSLGHYVDALVRWVIEAGPPMLRELGVFVGSLLGYLVDHLPEIIAQLGEWAAEFVSWLVDVVPDMLVAAGELLAELLRWIGQESPKLGEKVKEWQTMFVQWIIDSWPGWQRELGNLWDQLMGWIGEKVAALSADGSLGQALVDGIKKGIDGAIQSVIDAGVDLVNRTIAAARRAAGIDSPSKVMAEKVGVPLSQGVAAGMQQAFPAITAAAMGAVKAAYQSPLAAAASTTYNTFGAQTFQFNGADLGAVRQIVREEVNGIASAADRRRRGGS